MLDEQNISDTEVQGDQQSQDQQQPPKKGKPKFDPNKPFTEVLSSKPAFDPNKPFEEVKKKGKEAASTNILQNTPSVSVPQSPLVGENNFTNNFSTPLVPESELKPKPVKKVDTLTTPDGFTLSVDVNKTSGIFPDQHNAAVNLLQSKINSGKLTPSDVVTVAKLTGKSPEATNAFLSGDSNAGISIDTMDETAKTGKELVDLIDHFNEQFGTSYNPMEVIADPQKTSDFTQQVRKMSAEKSAADFAAQNKERQRIGESLSRAGSMFDLKNVDTKVRSTLDILDPNSFVAKAGRYQQLLNNHTVYQTILNGEKNNDSKDKILNDAAKRINPDGYWKSVAVGIPDVGSIKSNPIAAAGVLFDGIFGTKEKDSVLETEIGKAALMVNQQQRVIANQDIAQGILLKDDNFITKGKLRLNNIKDDMDILLEYPTMLKQKIAEEVSREIAISSGNLEGSETQGGIENWKNKVFGAHGRDYRETNAMQKYLNDPKTKDIAESMLSEQELFSDASFVGGTMRSFFKPLKDLGLGILDLSQFRSEKDIYADKLKDEMFPEQTPRIKESVATFRGAANTTSSLVMMGLISTATAGEAAPIIGALRGVKAVEGLNGAALFDNLAEVASVQKIATHLGSYTSFAIPSIDDYYKEGFNFLDNENARRLYALGGAILNGEGGRLMEIGKVIKIKGVSEDFMKLADGISKKTISEDAAKEIVMGKGGTAEKITDFLTKYATNVSKGAAVMTGFNVGNGFLNMAFGDPNTTPESIREGAAHAFMSGLLGMSILGGFQARADVKNSANSSFTPFIFNMAVNKDAAKAVFQKGLKDGVYTQEQYNEKMQILNTSVSAYNTMRVQAAERGINLDQRQKAVYVANKTTEAIIANKLKNTSKYHPEEKERLEAQLDNLKNNSAAVLDGMKFSPTLQPLTDLYDAQKKYEVAIDKVGRGEAVDDFDGIKKTYAKLYKKYIKEDKDFTPANAELYKVNNKPSSKKEVTDILSKGRQEADKYDITYTGSDNDMHDQLKNFGGETEDNTTISPKSRETVLSEGVNDLYNQLTGVLPKNSPFIDPLNREESVNELANQALTAPSGVKSALNGNEALTTELIARNTTEDINKSIESWKEKKKGENVEPSLIADANKHIDLLEKGLERKGNIHAEDKISDTVKDVTVGDMLDKAGTYKGNEGTFYQDGDTVIFKDKETGVEHELGGAEKIGDNPIAKHDITHEQSLVGVDESGKYTLRGKTYSNPFEDRGQNPTDAILYDKDGNVKNVRMIDENGNRRTITGKNAEDLAYQIHLKEITKDNGTTKEFEQFVNEDADAQKEVDNAGDTKSAEENTDKTDETVSAEKAEPEVKEFSHESKVGDTVSIDGINGEIKEIDDGRAYIVPHKENRLDAEGKPIPEEDNGRWHDMPKKISEHSEGIAAALKAKKKAATQPDVYTIDNLNEIKTSGYNDTQKKVLDDVKNVVKSISKIVSDTTGKVLNINIHNGKESFEKAVLDAGGDKQDATAKGFYMSKDGSIHLNMDRVSTDTMLHEGFHPLLDYVEANNPEMIGKMFSQLEGVDGAQEFVDKAKKIYGKDGKVDTTVMKEAITDFIASVADGKVKIDETNKEKIRNFISKILDTLGLKGLAEKFASDKKLDLSKAEDLKKLAQLISGKFEKGEEVTKEDLNKKEVGSRYSEKPQFQTYGGYEKNGFEETEEYKKLVKDGHIVENYNIASIGGRRVFITSPDNMMVGTVSKEKGGESLMTGEGGVNFVSKTGDVWAFSKGKGNPLVKFINAEVDANGSAYVILTKGGLDKTLNTHAGAIGGMHIIEDLVGKGFISKSVFRNALREAGKKYELKFSGNTDTKTMHEEVKREFYDKPNSTFINRGGFINDLISGITQGMRKDSKTDIEAIKRELNIIGENETLNKKNVVNALGKMFADEVTMKANTGDAYAAIEVSSKVKVVNIDKSEGGHSAYPDHIRLENPKEGERPKLLILDKPRYIGDISNDEGNSPVVTKKDITGADKYPHQQLGSSNTGFARGVLKPSNEIESSRPEFSKENEDEDIVSASVNVAPLFSTKVDNIEQARQLHNSDFYKEFKKQNIELAKHFGLTVERQDDGIGGFAGVSEAATVVHVSGKFENIVKYAAVRGALTPEVQESTIAGMFVKAGSENHNADRVGVGIDNMDAARRAAKDAGFDEAGYTLLDNEMSFYNIKDYPTENFDEKIATFADKYIEYGGQITSHRTEAIRSKYIDAEERAGIISEIKREGLRQQQGGAGLRNELEKAEKRNEAFLKLKGVQDSDAAKEYKTLRKKQLDLDQKGNSLSTEEKVRIKQLEDELVTPLASIISSDKEQFTQAKKEVEAIANDVSTLVQGGFKSEFGVKRPNRAATKVIRWYDVQPTNLGDGARTNVIVNTNGDADFVFNEVNKMYGTEKGRSEQGDTELGYPKRLVEIRTRSGKIAEVQVMTPQGYLAKDGIKNFPKNAREKAQKSLSEVRGRVGWDMPDGAGHYFYEINRDTNIPKELRDEAKSISKKYYDAFLNPDSKLSKTEFMNDVSDFNDKVNAADKTHWDKNEKGETPKSPDTLNEFIATDNSKQNEAAIEAIDKVAQLKKSVKEKERAMQEEAVKFGETGRKVVEVNRNFERIINHLQDNNKIKVRCP